MLSPLKHITHLTLLVLLIGNFVSCQSWHEAKAIVVEADSLLAKGVIMNDTALLARAIEAFDKPVCRLFAREELAKAYYLMGRNLDDYHHNFADAADYYIAADRQKTKDIILRGRINSCMGYLCKQDSCFKEALVFYERSSNSFKASGNEWYYAHNLLNVAEQYINLKQYNSADSVLAIAKKFEVDSVYYCSLMDLQGYGLYRKQQYDSALVYLLTTKDYPRNIINRCYNYEMILRCYNQIDDVISAVPYAEYIINQSNNATYRSNAYYLLIQIAKRNNDIGLLTQYSTRRADEDRILQHLSEFYAQASKVLNTYLYNPNPFRYWGIAIVICLLFSAFVTILGMLYRKRTKKIAQEKTLIEVELCKWQEQMREKLAIEEANAAAKRKIIGDIVRMHDEDFLPNNEIWKDEKELFRLANSSFGFIIYRLRDTYRNLNNRELKICLMVLLGFPNKTIANIVYCSEDSISTLKQRLAKKLSTSPREMREFLMDFIMKIA